MNIPASEKSANVLVYLYGLRMAPSGEATEVAVDPLELDPGMMFITAPCFR